MTRSLLLACLCLSLAVSSIGSDLKLVILVHRHGDRGPIYPMPTVDASQFAQDFPLGPGELTGIGMSQLYELGTNLHAKYVGPNAVYPNFLSPHWNHSEYSVRCTDFHRTLQSAESLLYAMFPPGTGPNNTNLNQPALPGAFQPVPISTVPQPTDYLLIGHDFASSNCPTYQKFVSDLENSPQYFQKAQQYQPLFDALHNITGFVNTMETASVSFDTFTCYKAHNLLQLRFPAVTQDMFDQLVDLARFELAQLAQNESINCLTSGPLVQDILSHIQQTVSSLSGPHFPSHSQLQRKQITPLTTLSQNDVKSVISQNDVKSVISNNKAPVKDDPPTAPLKFVHYSAHDSTVWPLLAATLGEYIFGQPPYAAHVVIELHQRAANDFFVRFFYNDTQVLLPYCHGQMDCALADFKAYLSPCGYPKMTDDPLCGIPAAPSVDQLLKQIAALQSQVSDLQNTQDANDSKVKRLTIVAGCLAAAAVILGGLLFFCMRYREIKKRNDTIESYSALGTGADV